MLKSGFVPDQDKSLWEPVQIITWLGVIFNTIYGSVKAADDGIVKLTTDLGTLSSPPPPCNIHVKTVTSVAGQAKFIGEVNRFRSR